MLLNNKVYNTLKWIAQYFLPASGTLYFVLAPIWDLTYGRQIAGTISVAILFLGILLGISTKTYMKSGADIDGILQIDASNPEKDIYRLQLNSHLEDLSKKNKVTFKVDSDAKLSD